MIQVTTILQITDNSGARLACCISVPKEARRIGASVGMLIQTSIRRVRAKQNLKKSRILKQGQIVSSLLIRTVRGFRRWGNLYFTALRNAVVVVNKQGLPMGSRVFGPVFREIRGKRFFKVMVKAAVAL